MLTIFGKKKKDETDGDKPAEATPPPTIMPTRDSQNVNPPSAAQSPSPSPLPSPSNLSQPTPSSVARAPSPQPVLRPIPPGAPFPEEETSLVRLLRSLVQDIPIPADTSSNSIPESTPDYVPLRSTPPSRPMMIGGGKDGNEWEGADDESPNKLIPAGPSVKPSKPVETPLPAGKTAIPSPIPPKPVEKAPEKPVKIEKPEKPVPLKKETRAPQSFDHIFQLTQGNLEIAGLVIFNGVPGSGRTTLCSGLTANYMKMSNPCLYLTYDQPPSELREQMKKLGTDAAQYESQFRFIVIDGYTSQSDSFSMEPYYLDQPFSFENIQDILVRNSGIFAGEKIRVVFDSMDKLVAKVPQKDFVKGFGELAGKLKDAGATFIVTVDMSALPKDLAGSLTDIADCVVDLSKDESDPNGRQLQVQRLNQKASKIDPETFEMDSNKGLVFV